MPLTSLTTVACSSMFRDRTVVIAGKRGVGKSSTLNALFGYDLPTDAAVECTMEPSVHKVDGNQIGGVSTTVVDMPGIAANMTSEARFDQFYRRWLRRADLLVWITQADVRAYKKDQQFFRRYVARLKRRADLVIAVSKFDTLLPEGADIHGSEAMTVVVQKVADLAEQLDPYHGRSEVVYHPYSVYKNWNVDALAAIVTGSSKRRGGGSL